MQHHILIHIFFNKLKLLTRIMLHNISMTLEKKQYICEICLPCCMWAMFLHPYFIIYTKYVHMPFETWYFQLFCKISKTSYFQYLIILNLRKVESFLKVLFLVKSYLQLQTTSPVLPASPKLSFVKKNVKHFVDYCWEISPWYSVMKWE